MPRPTTKELLLRRELAVAKVDWAVTKGRPIVERMPIVERIVALRHTVVAEAKNRSRPR